MTTARLDLSCYGIHDVKEIVRNPSYDQLYVEELSPDLVGYERGVLTKLGAVKVDTGVFTGRSPKDKYIVMDDTTRDTVWWADGGKNDNKPITPEIWSHLKTLVVDELSNKRLFVIDGYRITSYNVCYTKLLRVRSFNSFGNLSFRAVFFSAHRIISCC